MIEPDSDVDNNSIHKGLLYETLCWTIWYASEPRHYPHVWEMVNRDIDKRDMWKDYP